MEGKLIRSTGEEREALGKRGMLGPESSLRDLGFSVWCGHAECLQLLLLLCPRFLYDMDDTPKVFPNPPEL